MRRFASYGVVLDRNEAELDPTGDGPRFGEPTDEPQDRRAMSEALEWIVIAIIAVAIAFAVKTWILQAFSIPSESMEPTLTTGDRLLVSKLDYRFDDPGRSDLIVFDNLDPSPGDPDQIIKRIVAVAGDTVASSGGQLVVNGDTVDEPYLDPNTPTTGIDPLVVPEDTVYVLGDNRTNSKDSRRVGPVPRDEIVGRARFLVWPPNRLSGL